MAGGRKERVTSDTEVYSNYFLVSFMNIESGKVAELEMFEGQPLDTAKLRRLLQTYQIITFNGNNFDIPLLMLALSGATCGAIKRAANRIIEGGLKGWQIMRECDLDVPRWLDHIDVFDVAPGMASLKIYGGRLHFPKMQDLPIEPDAQITLEQRELLRAYCRNDLGVTRALFLKLLPQIELREKMTEEYGVDLRSKSDAQIAEAVIVREVEKLIGRKVDKANIVGGASYSYLTPEFVQFSSEQLRDLAVKLCSMEFIVGDNGAIIEPAELKGASISIGASRYRLGIGGLHSSEERVSHESDDDYVLVDRDVVSYYPAIILRLGLMPKTMGSAFLKVYNGILNRRVAAKKSGDKVSADTLKIVVNGSFGKFGSKWSKLYGPNLLIQTTVTGQLCLLMLIEALEAHDGISVVSANTDGVVIKCRRDRVEQMDTAVIEWEQQTGFETEATNYRSIFSRDVNNYFALKDDGYKIKGTFASVALAKNPVNEICNEAALRWMRDGVAIETTVRSCNDIRKFVTIRQVKGGALKGDQYLGKAVRWYYAKGTSGVIQYKVNGYTVARTEGAKPCMDLPPEFPSDVDYDWYINEAVSILSDVGALNEIA